VFFNKYLLQMEGFIEWLKNHLLTCPSKHFFYFDCPGCGLQRSVISLFEGDLLKSLQLYPATIPVFFCLIFTALHLKFNFKHGASVIKVAVIFTTSVIVFFYVYKIFTRQLL
jgi:hypothetical protein